MRREHCSYCNVVIYCQFDTQLHDINTNKGLMVSEDIRALHSMSSQTPKALGYCWETDQLEDHVKVDDGLEKPFYLPMDLCSTPKATSNTMYLLTELTIPGVYGRYRSKVRVKKTSGPVANTTRSFSSSQLERRRAH
jgi:hypothetical protein